MKNENILRKYIQTIVESFSKFSIREYQDLYAKDESKAYTYLKKSLQKLGHGSSRVTFLLSSRKVLKVIQHHKSSADGKVDIEQNKKEFDISRQSPIVPRVFQHDEDFTWIISELIREASGRDEACAMLGIKKTRDFDKFAEYVVADFLPSKMERNVFIDDDNGERIPWSAETLVDFYGNGTRNVELIQDVKELRDLVRIHKVSPSELRWNHFGKTADGRIVMFDTGY